MEKVSFPVESECPCCNKLAPLFVLDYTWGRDNSAEAVYYCHKCGGFSFILQDVPHRKLVLE